MSAPRAVCGRCEHYCWDRRALVGWCLAHDEPTEGREDACWRDYAPRRVEDEEAA